MKVSLIVEGAYPYINGGMSNWVQQLMLRLPEVEFIIQTIVAKRGEAKKFLYKIPDNCSRIEEIYLMDDDYVSDRVQNRLVLPDDMYQALEDLMFGQKADWDRIIRYFISHDISLNALLCGEDFLSMVMNYYKSSHSRIVFVDFLWTMRSMYLPLFTMLKSRVTPADLYHSASSGYAGIWASMQKVAFNKPFVLTEHGIYTREREEEIIKADWVKGIYKDLWIRQFHKIGDCCYEKADVVTSLYEDARQYQIELGCDPAKTIVCPNGMDPKRFANVPGKDPNDKFINIGALLRVTPIKDVKTLINAFALAKSHNSRLKLWIMGDMTEAADYARECRDLVDELHIPDVEFTGVIKPADYIGRMDIMMLSSLSEGQPLSILEAFTAKKPFICTNVGNCRGLLEGEMDNMGPAGIIVPIMNTTQMAKAMLKLADDEQLRKKMGQIGYDRTVQYYDETECYQRYLSVYRDVISRAGGGK